MPNLFYRDTPGRAAALWGLIGMTALIAVAMVLLEASLVALLTGHFPNRITSTLFANLGFFATYLMEAPGTTLHLLLIDKPLLEIAAVRAHDDLDIWRLYYYNYANLLHVGLALLLARYWHRVRDTGMRNRIQLAAGIVLLLSSSLYLYNSSCCTGGPLWIVHTGLIARLFNPVTSTVAMLDIYTAVQPWLGWLQAGFALGGGLMIGYSMRRSVR